MNNTSPSKIKATVFWTVVTVLSAVYLLNNLLIVADIGQCMPADAKNKNTQIVLNQAQKVISENTVFVQISGNNTQNAANISQQLKIALAKNRHWFEQVQNNNSSFNASKFQSILKYRYLLGQPSSFSANSLKNDFNHLLDNFRSGAPSALIEYLRLDPQRQFSSYLSSTQMFTAPKTHFGVWFVHDNALLVVKLNDSLDAKGKSIAITAIKNTFKNIDNTANTDLLLSGASVIAFNSRQRIQNTIQLVSSALIVIILLVFGFFYRSIYLAFLVSIPLGISILVTMAVVQAIFGQIHGIVLAFGITALGVCIDYALHLFSHLRKDEKATLTFKRIWPILRISALSSILAYMSLIASGFDGLTQLAIFAAFGLFTALMVSRFLLPVWIMQKNINIRYMPTHKPLSLHAKLLYSMILILFPLIFLLVNSEYFSINVNQINPVSTEQREIDKQLKSALGVQNTNHLFLISKPDVQAALVATQALKKNLQVAVSLKMIGGSLASSDLLPSHQMQKHRQALLPNKKRLQKQVAEAIKNTPLRPATFNQFIHDVEMSETAKMLNYQDIEHSIMGERLRAILFEKNGVWYSIIKPFDVNSELEFVEWVKNNAQLQPYYYSINNVVSQTMGDYQRSTWTRIMIMLLVLVLIAVWWARIYKYRIWVIAPMLSGVLISLSFQLMLGHSINIFHLLSLLLVIGMGIDYGLFFNQPWHNKQQLQQRTHAVNISVITTVATFSILAFSDIVVLNSIGQVVVVGIVGSFICAKYLTLPLISSDSCAK